jgi:hypothetical protein
MKKLIFFTAICVALALAGIIGTKIGGVKMAAELQSNFAGAEEAYLQKRFDAAYRLRGRSAIVVRSFSAD